MEGKSNSLTQIRELVDFFRRMGIVPIHFFLAIGCTALSVVFNLLGMALLIKFLRGLIEGNFTTVHDKLGLISHVQKFFPSVFSSPASYLVLLLSTIVISLVVKNFLVYFSSLNMDQQSKIVDRNVRKLIIGRCLAFGKQFYDGIAVSDISKTMIRGSETITGQLGSLRRFLGQVMLLAAYLFFMCWISWKLTLFLVITFPVHHFFFGRLIQQLKESSLSQETSYLDFSLRVFNVVSAIGLVKAYACEKDEVSRLTELSDKQILLDHEAKKKELLIAPIQELSRIALLGFVAFLMMQFSSDSGHRNVSSHLVFFLVAMRTIPLFGALTQFNISVARAEGTLVYIRYIMNEEKKYYISEGTKTFQSLRESIEIRNLNFGYLPDVPVLRNLSLSLKKGQTTAIVGSTGAGKTTVAHLLMRFYECPPGSIFLDGKDVRDFSRRSLMDRVAFVAQEPMFFNDTLRNNLCYGLDRGISEDEIQRVIRMAELGKVVERLPLGLESLMGDRGVLLSGGERQRVMIARALLKGADILILDEATSAMDAKTEKRVQSAIAESIKGRTAIVIAHRLSTIADADKIVVIENGQVVEQGTLDELLDSRGPFFEYWKIQGHFRKDAINADQVRQSSPAIIS
ncbi:MAG: ABC transporter ATP-binding protein [Candidatus Omnitrophica bacterium]|nr:ABC transporter ATP-binding protein [Candidatus Omnitrophota bacterium]